MNKQLVTEFIGTFFLVLIIALTGDPVAIGLGLVALVYMGGYISGAHYNPAVTIGLWVSGAIDRKTAIRYVWTQMGAGIMAALVYFQLMGEQFLPAPGKRAPLSAAYLVEILFTFALVSVIHHVAVSKKAQGNQYYGLSIGMTLLAAVTAGGPISGGAFNPAVGAAPLLVNISGIPDAISTIMLYVLGPVIGGVLAGWFYKITNA